jgi:hypothetical protein
MPGGALQSQVRSRYGDVPRLLCSLASRLCGAPRGNRVSRHLAAAARNLRSEGGFAASSLRGDVDGERPPSSEIDGCSGIQISQSQLVEYEKVETSSKV